MRTVHRLPDAGFVPRLVLAALMCLGTWAAQAGALNGPISVTLLSPGGITTNQGATVDPFPGPFSDSVSVVDGIHANDGPGGFLDTNIGGFMLPGEFVVFDGSADISLRMAAGSQDDRGTPLDPLDDILGTGYLSNGSDRARYVLSGLGIAGRIITGFSITGSGFTVPVDLNTLIDFDVDHPETLSIFLDTPLFTPDARGALFAGGNLNITFESCARTELNCGGTPPNPAPEPASLALVLAALAAVPAWRRRSAATAKRLER